MSFLRNNSIQTVRDLIRNRFREFGTADSFKTTSQTIGKYSSVVSEAERLLNGQPQTPIFKSGCFVRK